MKAKSLLEWVNESFELKFEDVVLDHINKNLCISESYLRLGSKSFNELLEVYREAFENKKFIPVVESDQFIFEKLDTGKKAYFKTSSGKMKKVTLDSPERNNDNEKSFKVYRKSKGEHEGLPLAKAIYWGMDDPKTGRSSIKNDDEGRVNSFWSRHKCSSKSDKNSAGWWACYAPELFGDKLKLAGGKNRW